MEHTQTDLGMKIWNQSSIVLVYTIAKSSIIMTITRLVRFV